jgi:hypothetical protein
VAYFINYNILFTYNLKSPTVNGMPGDFPAALAIAGF